MARSKRGRAGQAARHQRNNANGGGSARRHDLTQRDLESFFPPRRVAAFAVTAHNFTLADEARNTAHNYVDPVGGDQVPKLRGKPVTFVSAGIVEPLKELDQELTAHVDCNHGPQTIAEATELDSPANPSASDEPPPFFIDTTGTQSQGLRADLHSLITSFRQRTPSSSSGSSEDVILFRGRNPARSPEPSPELESECAFRPVVQPSAVDHMNIQVQTVQQTMRHVILESTDQPQDPRQRASLSPPAWQLRGHDDEADMIADYIANMAQDDGDGDDEDQEAVGRLMPSFGTRDLGGADGDVVLTDESENEIPEAGQAQDRDRFAVPDDHNEEDEEDDEEAVETFDDEALARLLARQGELGLDDEDLVIYSAEGFGAVEQSVSIQANRRGNPFTADRGKKGIRGQIPSASAVADAFDELDLMDWDRHNPPRRPKSKRGQPNFDISDPELEATLQSAWNKDRLRKKERKLEREELRAQGLLGKKADPIDMRVKYPTGMTIDQIKEEIREFLMGTDEIRSFPPMDSDARKRIHEISLKFNIKSKSTGKGDTRRPVLHRTKRTVQYREVYFEEVFNRSGRKYFHRMDKNRPQGKGTGGPGGASGRRGGVNHAAFSYKDGEVVGGSAPELGQNNKGRALLEKMGWSTGMALGATDNKGILQPVAHVVKRTKAGLG